MLSLLQDPCLLKEKKKNLKATSSVGILKYPFCLLWFLSLKHKRPRIQALLAVPKKKCFKFYNNFRTLSKKKAFLHGETLKHDQWLSSTATFQLDVRNNSSKKNRAVPEVPSGPTKIIKDLQISYSTHCKLGCFLNRLILRQSGDLYVQPGRLDCLFKH